MFLSSRTSFQLVLSVVLWLSTILPAGAQICAWQCGFGRRPQLTLARQAEQADVLVQVSWKESRQEAAGNKGVTLYEITRIVKEPKGLLKIGDKLRLPGFRAGTEEDTFLLAGSQAENIMWGTPLKVTRPAFQYVAYISSHNLSREQRLLYFLSYLEHDDDQIANDAYSEFAKTPYNELLKVRESIPTEDVRRWIADPQTVETRRGLYGKLLGLSGNSDDAAALLETIDQPAKDYRPGLDGLMTGYLIISGSEGLEILEILKHKNNDTSFSDLYAALQALRFMWKYEPDRISKARLRQSMRMLLDRPGLTDLVITDLARWEDWEAMDRLLEMYDDEHFSTPSIQRAIIQYLAAYQKTAEQVLGDPPAYAVKVSAALEDIQKENPKLYKTALRFFR